MKLLYTSASPYVRRVVLTAVETGLDPEIERITATMSVWVGDGDPAVVNDNPLGEIPTLVTRDGTILIDSTLICEYLTSLAPEVGLLPAGGPEQWRVLYLQTLAQGDMDAIVSRALETKIRPAHLHWDGWIARQTAKILRSLDNFEAVTAAGKIDGAVTLGTITLACGSGYLDGRLNDPTWRDGRRGLSQWYDSFAERESMRTTMPHPLSTAP